MTLQTGAPHTRPLLDPIELTLDAVASPLTKRAYRKALDDFFEWWDAQGRPPLSKALTQRYRAVLIESGLAASSVNVRLSALRKMVRECADNGLLGSFEAESIAKVPGLKQHGHRSGTWLSKSEAQELLLLPDTTTLRGLRDRALLAVLLSCGLRRSEAVNLSYAHLQQREGRWVILDMSGKHGRVRTVPVPGWCKAALDAWSVAAGLSAGRVFRPTTPRGEHLGRRERLSPEAISVVVRHYGAQIGQAELRPEDLHGVRLAPHDLRRTFAKLAHKGGAPIDQIQLSLGHASLVTTEVYLGLDQNLEQAPGDVLGLSLKGT